MKNILCYGDSNTWGLNPEFMLTGKKRLDWDVRWTGRLQALLGSDYRIIEEGLNGRTTVFDDPTSFGRSGLQFLNVCIESHLPLDLIIIVLGTNDTKTMFNATVVDITKGVEQLLMVAKNPFLYAYSSAPEILIGAPVSLGEGITTRVEAGSIDALSYKKSKKLAAAYKNLADLYQCHFIDLDQYAQASKVDNVHLDADSHNGIANAMRDKINEILL